MVNSTSEKSELAQLDIQHILHPFTSPYGHTQSGPRIMVKGEGCILTDIDGNEYIDALSSLWNVNIGHGRRELGEAALEQISTLDYTTSYNGFSNIPAIKLAEKLAELAPGSLNSVFFTSGGGEANETAFKMARVYWRLRGYEDRVKIIARWLGFHGLTYGAMSATGIPLFWERFGPVAPGFIHIDPPYRYRCERCKGHAACTLGCADALEERIIQEGPETVAAFIAEPIQGAGGVIVPPSEYFARIREICDKYGVLFIADEVITGFGRTGRWFGIESHNVVPDIMTFAKGVTSAYQPLGGALISDAVRNVLLSNRDFSLFHGFTNNGHPTVCAVALKNLDIMESESLIPRAAEMGKYLQKRLSELADHPLVGEVRGFGLLAALELVQDKKTGEKYAPILRVAARVVGAAMDKGVISRTSLDNIVAFAPPLIITEKQIDTVRDVMEQALNAVKADLPA